jgi:hypothetical protein
MTKKNSLGRTGDQFDAAHPAHPQNEQHFAGHAPFVAHRTIRVKKNPKY